MSALRNPWPAAGWLAITLLPGCGGGDRAAPDPVELAIAKPDTLSGDRQVGVAGAEPELALRVVVTRDSLPAAGVPVVWPGTRSWWAGRQPVRPGGAHDRGGGTVNWFWPPGSAGHNVVPDDGDSPPQSGPPVGYPKYHSYQFTAPGVYRYHCLTHGAAGGVGMSGTITVDTSCGTSCKE